MFIYFIICSFSCSVIVWFTLKSINKKKKPPSDDDGGGLPLDNGLPIIDLPPTYSLDDILVDRWYDRDFELIE